MKKWIYFLLIVVLCMCVTTPAYAVTEPEKPGVDASAEQIEEYNKQVDEYNTAVDEEYEKAVQKTDEENLNIEEQNNQIDEEYAAAVEQIEQKNTEIEQENVQAENEYKEAVQNTTQHNEEENKKVEASEKEIAEYEQTIAEISEENQSRQDNYNQEVEEINTINESIVQENEESKQAYENEVANIDAHNEEENKNVEASEEKIAEYERTITEINEENQTRKQEYEEKTKEINTINESIVQENEESKQAYENEVAKVNNHNAKEEEKIAESVVAQEQYEKDYATYQEEYAAVEEYNAKVDEILNTDQYSNPTVMYNSSLGDIQISNAGIVSYKQRSQTVDGKRGTYTFWNSMWLNEANTSYMRFSIEGDITDKTAETVDKTENFYNVKGQVYSYTDLTDPSTYESTSELINLVYSSGYYYLPTIVGVKSFVDLYFETWNYVRNWTNVYKKQVTVHANVSAEAIQSDNFYPNFEAEDPWQGETIEQGIKTEKIKTVGDYITTTPQTLSVTIDEKKIDLIEIIPENLAETRNKIMPGDTIAWKVILNNISEYDLTVNYQMVYNIDSFPILEEAIVTLLVDDNQVYLGNFIDTIFSLSNFVDSANITMTVYIPTNLKNRWENSNLEYGLNFFAIPIVNYKDYPVLPTEPEKYTPDYWDYPTEPEYKELLPLPTVEYLSYPEAPIKYIPDYWDYPAEPEYKELLPLPTVEYLPYPAIPERYIPDYWNLPNEVVYQPLLPFPEKSLYKNFKVYPQKPNYLKPLKYNNNNTDTNSPENPSVIIYTEPSISGEIIEDNDNPLSNGFPLPKLGDNHIDILLGIFFIALIGVIISFKMQKENSF